ncbi:MAG: hypothetical protein ACYCXW_04645 [Solirubrobacteraceae bacterium]
MTRPSNGNGSGELPTPELVVVHVTDAISTTLAGRDGVEYQSPPLARTDALDLVRVLVGDDPALLNATEPRWRCPIAGGQRTVTLTPARNGTEPTRAG